MDNPIICEFMKSVKVYMTQRMIMNGIHWSQKRREL